MNRRNILTALGASAAAWPLRAFGQAPGGVPRVGMLGPGPAQGGPFVPPMIRALAKHGLIGGKTIEIVSRGAEGDLDRLPALVDELVASRVQVIIAFGYRPVIAAQQGSKLPVVEFSAGDPIATGLPKSLARPGGNVTGISDVSAEVTPKRLELLKDFAPKLHRVAMLYNADDIAMTLRYKAAETGATALGIEVQPLGVREPSDFNEAFAAMTRDPPDGLFMVADPLTNLNRKAVFAFAAAHRLPAIYEYDFIARDGGLMSYGPDLDESFDRMAVLVDRILRGARPSDLPFEEPTRFLFVLNLKTAKAAGLEVPSAVLAAADDVIE